MIPCMIDSLEDRCRCLIREKPPDHLTALQFEATKENIPKFKEWIVEYYRSLAFNQCTHQGVLLVESSPPLNLMVDPTVVPTAVHKPAQVRTHSLMCDCPA